MTDPWCWYIYANIYWGYIDGIHVIIYIAAPWIRHGLPDGHELDKLKNPVKPRAGA
jgi:hypothetical protein